MDTNVIALITCLIIYIGALAIASKSKINLKPVAVIAILAAFWFGFQWKAWIGTLAVLGGVVLGIIILRLLIGKRQ